MKGNSGKCPMSMSSNKGMDEKIKQEGNGANVVDESVRK